MGIQISRELESRLADEARRLGISVDALLTRFVEQSAAVMSQPTKTDPELPVWHLGAVSAFRRRDMYDDARF